MRVLIITPREMFVNSNPYVGKWLPRDMNIFKMIQDHLEHNSRTDYHSNSYPILHLMDLRIKCSIEMKLNLLESR